MERIAVTLARGDGIGPEISEATVRILEAAKAPIDFEEIQVGLAVYESGTDTGILQEGWDSLRKTKVFLKAPITTPQGGGMKSLNVTVRKALGLYANIRPCTSYFPFIATKHHDLDLVIIRENEEDLYAGIEHRQTHDTVQCLKLLSRPGTEKIIRYAFEYAKAHGRRKVSCFTKDNIMKLTDGMFHDIFNLVAAEYPDLENDHYIIDIGTARLADTPERFDVIVTTNLYGDIISDVAAQVAGSVGIAGSANVGDKYAMFEAIHGAAPDIAGLGIANPTGMIFGAVQMLIHLGLSETASTVHNAVLKTIEDGVHTADIYGGDNSKKKVSTKEFTNAVVANMGELPKVLRGVAYPKWNRLAIGDLTYSSNSEEKALVGVDVFFDWNGGSAVDLALSLQEATEGKLSLKVISNRGLKVWPDGFPDVFCTEHWRCRFLGEDNVVISHMEVVGLLSALTEANLDFIKTEHLYLFDGIPGFSV